MEREGGVVVDEREFGEFFASQYARLCWLGLLLTGSRAEGEELAQEALVRTWWRWALFRRRAGAVAATGFALVAGLALVAGVGQLVQDRPETATSPKPAEHACGPAADAATARTIDVYVAVLQHLMANPNARGRPVRVLYVVDRAVPYDDNAGMLPSERRQQTAPRSASTAAFAESVKGCLASVRFPNLPPIRLVSGYDDPRVAKAGRDPFPVVADGRVVQLEGVPPQGDRLELAASSNGGGGLDAFGGVYILGRRDGAWRVVDMERGWIA